MTNTSQLSCELFLECDWNYDTTAKDHLGYFSVMSHLQESAKKMKEAGRERHSLVLKLLANAASMTITASSLNKPFEAYFHHISENKRSAVPDDFTPEDLLFFEKIIDHLNEPWLKARLADLLWLLKKPRDKNHALIAITSYTSHPIHEDTWHNDIKTCWERAARLCIQIGDRDRLDKIKNSLVLAFDTTYQNDKFMTLSIAELLDKLKIDTEVRDKIATTLFDKANELKSNNDFSSARGYLELASKKYQQCSDEKGRLKSLHTIAECFETEADLRASDSQIIANSLYEHAIQAYRRIPSKHRSHNNIEDKIKIIHKKITASGQASHEEMHLINTPELDISDIIKLSIKYVAKKQTPEEALLYFISIDKGPSYEQLTTCARKNIKQSLISNLFGSTHLGRDGRTIAKTPAINLDSGENDSANQAVLQRKIQEQFLLTVQVIVNGQILPALEQILMEHRFTKELMVAICNHSPIVPKNRKQLLGHALWLGFEYDFGSAIHLLCPQIEHIVRTKLKESGAHTSNIDKNGIENENGLSTLMELPQATQIFGTDLTFEIKSVFTEALGFNLRNEVAHGLLDDNSSATITTIYAWWMTLRLVISSLRHGKIKCSE